MLIYQNNERQRCSPVEGVCTCQTCDHDHALYCVDCACCKEGAHSIVVDGMIEPEKHVSIPAGPITLEGELHLGTKPAIVVFAHGSGSSRNSSRNKQVASALEKVGLGTLLFDLLTTEEERLDEHTGHLRFDIGFLADRLTAATQWLKKRARDTKIGYFGGSTGAAAALVAAAKMPDQIKAVVSRGGRPDLANGYLERVRAPTLLIVGGNDYDVIRMNKEAFDKLKMQLKKIEVVPGATHLFEEPGKLEEVARLARGWFEFHLH